MYLDYAGYARNPKGLKINEKGETDERFGFDLSENSMKNNKTETERANRKKSEAVSGKTKKRIALQLPAECLAQWELEPRRLSDRWGKCNQYLYCGKSLH